MTLFLVLLLVVFVLASGFFSTSETALFSLSPMRVRAYRRDPDKRRQQVAHLLAYPQGLLVTILMMNVLANLLVQNASSSLFAAFPGWALKVGLPLLLTLLFGEIIPKSIALPNNEKLAVVVGPAISWIHRILRPLRLIVTRVTGYVSRIMFFFLRKEREISQDELLHALDQSQAHGVLTREESELVSGYLHIHQAVVKEVMRPREEILAYETSSPLSTLTELFVSEQVTRVPVCNGGIENLLGVMEADDYFILRDRISSTTELCSHLRKPFYVPESMAARTLLRRFDRKEESMALVVDEYGSISGLITHEDLVEVIVGDIADRRDQQQLYTRAGKDVVIASGKLELEDFNDLFDKPLSSRSHSVTLGGWLLERLGSIPKAGTKLVTEEYLFHILAADPNRIRRVYIRRLAPNKRGKERLNG